LQRSLERSHRSPWRFRSTINSGKGVESFHGENLFNLFLEEQKMGTLGLTGAFAAGLVVVVGPSSLPIISVIAGYVIGAEEERRLPRLLGFLATEGGESVGRVSFRYALCFCHLTFLSADCAIRDDSRSRNGTHLVWRTSSPCFWSRTGPSSTHCWTLC